MPLLAWVCQSSLCVSFILLFILFGMKYIIYRRQQNFGSCSLIIDTDATFRPATLTGSNEDRFVVCHVFSVDSLTVLLTSLLNTAVSSDDISFTRSGQFQLIVLTSIALLRNIPSTKSSCKLHIFCLPFFLLYQIF